MVGSDTTYSGLLSTNSEHSAGNTRLPGQGRNPMQELPRIEDATARSRDTFTRSEVGPLPPLTLPAAMSQMLARSTRDLPPT